MRFSIACSLQWGSRSHVHTSPSKLLLRGVNVFLNIFFYQFNRNFGDSHIKTAASAGTAMPALWHSNGAAEQVILPLVFSPTLNFTERRLAEGFANGKWFKRQNLQLTKILISIGRAYLEVGHRVRCTREGSVKQSKSIRHIIKDPDSWQPEANLFHYILSLSLTRITLQRPITPFTHEHTIMDYFIYWAKLNISRRLV